MYVFKATYYFIFISCVKYIVCIYSVCLYVCMYVCMYVLLLSTLHVSTVHICMYVCMYGIGSVYLHRYSFLCWSGVHLLLMRAVQFARPNFQQLFVVSQVQSSSMYICMYVCLCTYILCISHIDGT